MHTNRLIHETSPYLLQHAHNAVDWYPWGQEALDKAVREDKPILVSIGYAACHWCHVMEKESFEDEQTAALMNQWFVNIKIDREERPDLDHLYMEAVQAITGSGGWPLNVFLTPSRKPFYGGTYFPPTPLYNRPSWKDVLAGVSEAFRDRRQEIEAQAENLTAHIEATNHFGLQHPSAPGSAFLCSAAELNALAEAVMKTADTREGGFGKAPKFPQTFVVRLLLHRYYYARDEKALEQARLSLDKMIDGGIHDQLGGGFARYATDSAWMVPHFEKMLYDNALLVMALGEAFQLTGHSRYLDAVHSTLGFVERELASPEGGYYAALDADSEGVEGRYYVWSRQEVEELLGADADLFCRYYNITAEGNWEHTNILHVTQPVESLAAREAVPLPELERIIARGKELLLAQRQTRVRPLTDDKILLGWNALLNTAFSKAFMASGDEKYRALAVKNMDFLLRYFSQDDSGRMFHTFKKGEARLPAFLDDYAQLIHALIHLQEITGNSRYLEKVKTLIKWVDQHFSEAETGYFYFTNDEQADVIVRKKELYDGAVPSGNSLMAWNLFYAGTLFEEPGWKERAVNMCLGIKEVVSKYPGSFGIWAILLQALSADVPEIVVTGTRTDTVLKEVLSRFIPFRVLQSSPQETPGFPLLAGKTYLSVPTMYLCKNYSCQQPVNEPDLFIKLLDSLT